MTQEEKQLVFNDLCARLSHGVMVSVQGGEFDSYRYPYQLTAVSKFGFNRLCKVYNPIYTPFGVPKVEDVKPYLRPMSSMTDEERNEFILISDTVLRLSDKMSTCILSLEQMDWLNKNMFDYRGLIPMGLALKAKEGMYKNK